jgi:AI-2 transport protein TqsA
MIVPHRPPSEEGRHEGPRAAPWRDAETVRTAACVVLAAAAGWYLLLQLAPILRPFLVASILAYVLMPYHARLRRRIGTPASLGVLAGSTAGALVGLAFVTYDSALALNDEVPHLQQRAGEEAAKAERALAAYAPWLIPPDAGKPAQDRINEQIAQVVRPVLNVAASATLEACVIALYLLFLLLEGSRFPDRVRTAYEPGRAAQILQIAGAVNAAVIGYLRAKVKTSLFLAVPVGAMLWALGVKFALLWGVLTFLCNFIPYIGTAVAYALPTGFAFLSFGPSWEAFAAAGWLLVCHAATASVVEPVVIGGAVGVSPLVILSALAFWGLLWGIPGMFLAVPLTVVAILVTDHFEQTRPIARLLKGG